MRLSTLSVATLMVFGSAIVAAADTTTLDIPYTKFTLDNGLRVIVHEDKKAPIVAVNVWYHVGSKDEKAGRTGFAHLFEHLMFNGSENYNDEYFGPFEKVGATDMNGTTWLDRTNYFQNVPKTALDMTLWMESDRMGHMLGAVTQEKLDEQRGVVQNEKRQGENQPYGRSFEWLQKGSFPEGHPYSWTTIGSMEDLNAAKLEDVHEWFKTYYGAANAVVVLAGDIDVETAKSKMNQYFGDIPAGPPLVKRGAWIAKRDDSKRDIMFDRVPQVRITKSWNVPTFGSKEADQLELVAAILGGGKNSRLYKTLVYDKQMATNVRADVMQFELASLFGINVDVKPGVNPAEVEAIINRELALLIDKGPSKKELERVKVTEEANFVRGAERIGGFGGKSDILATYEVYTGEAGNFKRSLEHKLSASTKDLQQLAKAWLSSGDYHLEVHPFPNYNTVASNVDRSKLPEVNSTPDLDFPKVERAMLSNGLKVLFAERHSVPAVNISLQIDSGFAADQGSKLGTANFALSMVDEGTKKLSASEISEKAEMLGANLGSGCALDVCSISIDMLKAKLDDSLNLFADVVLNPAFDQEEIDRLRGRWLANIAREKAQPVSMAFRTLPPLLYGNGHSYAMPFTGSGTEQSITALNRDDLVAFYQKWVRPDNATLVVVGDTTLSELLPKLEKSLGGWKAPATPKPIKNLANVPMQDKTQIFLIDKPGAVQSVIIAGQLMPGFKDDEAALLYAMNDIIGGQFTARLNMNLREQKSWAYGAYTIKQNAVGQSPYFAYAPVQIDKTVESMQEVLNELKAYIGSKPATEAELQKTVLNTVRSQPGEYETMDAVQGALVSIANYQRPDNYVEQIKARYEALTVADINAAAKQYLRPQAMTWVVVTDLSKTEQKIRDLKLGEVTVIDADGNKLR
ncbi:M16 family metallopeptidase [Permianibacter aggregans]|uniref:Zinc protease n=1 Tax=Permianibacter aggregans TaxID=1510150 RepID=A0A4V3D6M9_9GAMM|nr:pitrilysin family protein [Permianibacter aggregans]QGX41122.1 insulinase family protein [Permianibacter aggregans]TDQ44567.1 zinc protease [Permianibacter aggregans]